MNDKVIILGTAHLSVTAGKCSPDKRLKEAEYSREIVSRVEAGLKEKGYLVYVDYYPLEPNEQMKAKYYNTVLSRELNYRVRFVNSLCDIYGKKDCLYVSIHNNAAPPNDGKWHSASGWSVFVSPNASQTSRNLAQVLYDEAESKGLKGNRCVPLERYWEGNFKVLRETKCPAVLTENLFQDNLADVNFLLMEYGKQTIADVHINGIDKFVKVWR